MDKSRRQFSVRKRLRSFIFAIKGVKWMLKTQHNAWIHLFATVVVIAAGFWFSLTAVEWALVALAIGFVFAAETFNTAIEMLVDKISPDYDAMAGRIKDLAAGAVLLAALTAVVVGIMVFGRKIWS